MRGTGGEGGGLPGAITAPGDCVTSLPPPFGGALRKVVLQDGALRKVVLQDGARD